MSLDSFSFFALAVATEDGGDGFLLLQIIGVICGILGLIFFLGSAVGMVRFPDFYTRMHAAGKGDTLSTMLMLGGFGLVTMDDLSVGSWLLLSRFWVLYCSYTLPRRPFPPLMRAAFEDDEMPMTEDDLNKTKKRGKKKR